MKNNLVHICFIIDESGSMYTSTNDVIGGFSRLVDEQKNLSEGECIISLYKFSGIVRKEFIGKPVNEITSLDYYPGGGTALYDGVGTAIDEIGEWLNEMDESERPSKNIIVIMTDGEENSSFKYRLSQIRDKIIHQEKKYNWTFVYIGIDLSSFKDSTDMGISLRSLSSRENLDNNYTYINQYTTTLRNSCDTNAATKSLRSALDAATISYLTNSNK